MPCPDDSQLADFARQRLTPAEAQAVERHLAECARCRGITSDGLATTQPRLAVDPPSPLGAAFGRYVLLEQLGRGGMGEVHAAYDPQLDRKVALKLLNARGTLTESQGSALLLREARTMAQLTHPNVVTVYEAGAVDGQVYLAMKLVPGGTLREWLAAGARGWRDVLPLFLGAGQGLAAAHAAGLVHRDFKPDNVLVTLEGTAQVTDFGLARLSGEAEGDARASPLFSDEGAPATRPGVIPGTPAYLAPERRQGSPADARSDQYSFCVALYEALHGARPSPGVPPAARVPAWLHRTVMRGLAANPAERWADMPTLLAALTEAPRARLRWALTVGAVALLIVAGAAGRWYVARGVRRCQGAGLAIASAWDAARKEAVRTAFGGSRWPYAEKTWLGVERALDDYVRAWSAMALEACEATHVARTQPEQTLDLRMVCLTRRRQEVAALTELFAHPDDGVLEKALAAATGLTPLSRCADLAELQLSSGQPEEPLLRPKVADVRTKLAQAKALEMAGKLKDAMPVAVAALAEAEALRFRPLVAEALLALGNLRGVAGEYGPAAELMRKAGLEAVASRNDLVAAQAWTRLIFASAQVDRIQDAREAEALALAAVERLTPPGATEGELHAQLWSSRGKLSILVEDPERAVEQLRHALALRERLSGPSSFGTADLLNSLASAMRELGKLEEGVGYSTRAIALYQELLGDQHPAVGTARMNLARLYGRLNDPREEGQLQQALAIFEATGTSKGEGARWTLNSLAIYFRRTGRHEEAQALYLRMIDQLSQTHGPEHLQVGMALLNLAMNDVNLKAMDAALQHAERGYAIVSKALQPDRPLFAQLQMIFAEVLRGRGDYRRAHPLYLDCLARLEKKPGQPYMLAMSLAALATNELSLGQPASAEGHLSRAHALLKQAKVAPHELLTMEYYRARAQWEQGRERSGARASARTAYQHLREGNPQDPGLAEMARWLKARGVR